MRVIGIGTRPITLACSSAGLLIVTEKITSEWFDYLTGLACSSALRFGSRPWAVTIRSETGQDHRSAYMSLLRKCCILAPRDMQVIAMDGRAMIMIGEAALV